MTKNNIYELFFNLEKSYELKMLQVFILILYDLNYVATFESCFFAYSSRKANTHTYAYHKIMNKNSIVSTV